MKGLSPRSGRMFYLPMSVISTGALRENSTLFVRKEKDIRPKTFIISLGNLS